MPAQFQIVMHSGPTTGKVYPLELPEITIGRDTNNTIVINDAEISRKHAKLTLHGNTYVVQDLGSTNGTFVNGMRLVSPQVLNPGDTVALGENITFSYEAAYDANATVVSSAKAPPTAVPAPRPAAPAPAAFAPPPPPASAPVPAYSGQVPAGPVPFPEAPAKKKFPVWIIIIIGLLLVICACVAFFVIIDQLRLWCTVVPFLVPLLGGACP